MKKADVYNFMSNAGPTEAAIIAFTEEAAVKAWEHFEDWNLRDEDRRRGYEIFKIYSGLGDPLAREFADVLDKALATWKDEDWVSECALKFLTGEAYRTWVLCRDVRTEHQNMIWAGRNGRD